jgi:hypothetical protein
MVAKCGGEGALELAADTVKGQSLSGQLLQAQQAQLVRWLCAELAHVPGCGAGSTCRPSSALMPNNAMYDNQVRMQANSYHALAYSKRHSADVMPPAGAAPD